MKRLFYFLLLNTFVLVSCQSTGEQAHDEGPINEKVSGQHNEKEKDGQLMDEFHMLLSNHPSPMVVAEFMDHHVNAVAEDEASEMIREFEQLQSGYLATLEEKFADSQVQEVLYRDYHSLIENGQLEELKDQSGELAELITEVFQGGYTIETAEGMYYPIIDYSFYKKYSSYATDDYQDYVNLMSTESDDGPAKDAALVISWKEVVDRALKQEQFLTDHPQSVHIEKVSGLYDQYLTFIFYGLDNTPLFEHETKQMNSEARTSYEKAIQENDEAETMILVKDFLQLVDESNGKVTEEVETFRQTHAPKK